MEATNINMIRGDTLAFGVEFEGLDQRLETSYFTCRKSFDSSVVFQKSLSSGISFVGINPDNGAYQYRVRVAPEDTKLLAPGTYRYDFQIGVNSDIFTLMWGALNLLPDTTY